MLQPDASLPEVPARPAPWNLHGSGWIVALRLPPRHPARDAFLPAELAGRVRGRLAFLVYADYADSACGPYRELLFVPGTLPCGDGRRHPGISRIVVSTWDSVVNGRRNWGIPKDRADFTVERDGGETRVRVDSDGRELCELRFAARVGFPALPVNGALLPARLRTLAQRHLGRTYYTAPVARGRIRPGRLLHWRFDAALFPDLADATVLAVLQAESFRMTFPPARVAG